MAKVAILQCPPKSTQSTVLSNPDGPNALSQNLGHLRVAQPVYEPQDDHLALVPPKGAHRPPHLLLPQFGLTE